MAPPIYFFAGRGRNDLVDPATQRLRSFVLESAGLVDVLRDVASARDQCALPEIAGRGPGGRSGIMLIALPPTREQPRRLGYHPEFQHWQQAGEDFWVGFDKEYPPTPADLLRETKARDAEGRPRPRHAGYPLTLADGHEWLAPIVRRPPAAIERGFADSELPKDIGWDNAGRFVETLKPEYRELWDDAEELCNCLFAAEESGSYEITVERGLHWCLRLLGTNYRYGRHEQNLLHAIDAETVFPVLGAAVDFWLVKRLLALEKKSGAPSTPPGSPIAPGSPDDRPSTAPAEENSG